MKNKLILFDWGNVVESHITGYTGFDAWNDLFSECGYEGNEPGFVLIYKYELSAISSEKEFERVYGLMKEEFHFNKTYKEFVKTYNKIFSKIDYYEDVVTYEHSLKNKCKIGVLSNLVIFDKKRIDKQLNLSKYDYVFLSFEMGLRKPNIKIFEEVQKKLPFKKEDILFIDDRFDNISAAKEFGWNTFQATGLEINKIKDVCEKFINS